ncbi:MAG TPA: ATP-binding protein [Verrucomicrobiae bacterium]|nr:ATP-binding protein [Verrucomicrobiae bacterium]
MVAIENDVRLTRWLKGFSRWDGWLVALGGGIVLLGWSLGNEMLMRILPGLVAMNPVTALGFILAGTSLVCYWLAETKPAHKWELGRAMGAVLVVIGVLKLTGYMAGWHLGFDQMLFRSQLRNDGTGFTNQIAPNTALNFILSGLALWFLHSPVRRFSYRTQNLSLALAFVSLVPLVGYIYRASYLYSIGTYIPMALHTAMLFFLLALGLLLAQTDAGVVALFTSNTPGGAVARRLLPFAFGVPILLGALTIWVDKSGIYPGEFGVTIVVVGSSAIFTGLIWWNAIWLNEADSLRRVAEEQLQKAHRHLEGRVQERTAMLNNANTALRTQIVELQRAEEKIRDQAELLNHAQDAILVLDIQHRVVFWNKGAERLYGWTTEEAAGKNADELLFKGGSGPPKGYEAIFQTGAWTGELEQIRKAGRPATVESRWTLVHDGKGTPRSILIINTDITEKKSYEVQLLRSQRMESIGKLAGGIAHDLNNALTPIIVGTQLLRGNNSAADRDRMLDTISASANRGAAMVRHILTFARGAKGQSQQVPLSNLVKEIAKVIQDTFSKSILINVNLGKALWNVSGDTTELYQVLLNLCVNARDAMPQGGELTLNADNQTLSRAAKSVFADVPAGDYVVLAVADTGTGIPPEVLPRIFEPLFTTKAPDKGTGLGLSTVAGIVKNHNAYIQIHTEAGKGTEFKIYLPTSKSLEKDRSCEPEKALPAGHGELILLMDDEATVRQLTQTTLQNYGYRVVTAKSGLDGMTVFEEYKDEIKVLVSDTDMPVLDGIAAIRAIQKLKPEIPVIITSGTERDREQLAGIDRTHLIILEKPYSVEQILNAVAQGVASKPEAEPVDI